MWGPFIVSSTPVSYYSMNPLFFPSLGIVDSPHFFLPHNLYHCHLLYTYGLCIACLSSMCLSQSFIIHPNVIPLPFRHSYYFIDNIPYYLWLFAKKLIESCVLLLNFIAVKLIAIFLAAVYEKCKDKLKCLKLKRILNRVRGGHYFIHQNRLK